MLLTGRNHTVYEVSAGVRSTRNEDGGIVLDVNRGKVFRLNGIGALIFERLREQRDETDIVKEVSHEFRIPCRVVRVDVLEFFKSLEQQGLVVAREGHLHDNQIG